MKMLEKKTTEFIEVLGSAAPVPGGGGASATVGSLAAALGMMVTNLTIGKKKYAEFDEDNIACRSRLQTLCDKLIDLTDGDAEAFEPLSRAYGMPKDDPNRAEVMESALYEASVVPLEIMEVSYAVIEELEALVEKGSKLAISDVGVAVLFAQAAVEGASLNVFINTNLMANKERAADLNARADQLIADAAAKKDSIYQATLNAIRPSGR